MTHTERHAQKGFTLIELMIAIAVLAVLSVIVIPGVMSYLNSARMSSAKSNLRAIDNAITNYQLTVGQLPSRLKDLVKAPSDEKAKKKWPGSFFKKAEIPEDPWGNAFQYKISPPGAKEPYELYSYGPNGKGAPSSEWIHASDQ